VKKEPPGFRALTRFVGRFRVPILIVGVLGGVPGRSGCRGSASTRATSTSCRRGRERPGADPREGPADEPGVRQRRRRRTSRRRGRWRAKLRALPEVGGVQTATDLLPALDDAAAGTRCAAGWRRCRPMPDFTKLAAQRTTPELLRSRSRRSPTGSTRSASGGSRAVSRPSRPRRTAHAAFKAVKQRLERLDDAGKARLAAIEPTLAGCWRGRSGRRAVAERGTTCRATCRRCSASASWRRDGEGDGAVRDPVGLGVETETAQAFRTRGAAVDPNVSGLAVNINLHETMIITGFRQAAGLAAVLIFLIVAFSCAGCGTRRSPWSRRRSAGCGCSG
jgi:hypothetical protein